jgi:hypothetical protein
MIKSRRMRWVEHVACMKKNRSAFRFLMGKLKARNRLWDLSIDGKS